MLGSVPFDYVGSLMHMLGAQESSSVNCAHTLHEEKGHRCVVSSKKVSRVTSVSSLGALS
jgi:hypothetical protein